MKSLTMRYTSSACSLHAWAAQGEHALGSEELGISKLRANHAMHAVHGLRELLLGGRHSNRDARAFGT